MYSIQLNLVFQIVGVIIIFCISQSASAETYKEYLNKLSGNLKGVDKKFLPQAYSRLTLTTGVKTTTTTTTTPAPTYPSKNDEDICTVVIDPRDIFIVTRVCHSNCRQPVQAVLLDNKSISLTYHTNISNISYIKKFKGLFQGKAFIKKGNMHLDVNIDPESVGLADPPVTDKDLFVLTVIRFAPYGKMRVVSQMVNNVLIKPNYGYLP